MPKMVEIPVSEYRCLLKDSEELFRLRAGGVDDWRYYSDSLFLSQDEPFDEFCLRIDREYPEC